MKPLQRMLCWAVVTACLVTVPTFAEDGLTERERELLRVVEDLQKRVSELEKLVGTSPAATVEERLQTVEEATEKEPGDVKVFYKSGLRFETEDGDHKLKIGGRVHADRDVRDASFRNERDVRHHEHDILACRLRCLAVPQAH